MSLHRRIHRLALASASLALPSLGLAQSYAVQAIPGFNGLEGSSANSLGNNGYVVVPTYSNGTLLYHDGVVTTPPTINGAAFDIGGVNGKGQAAGSYQTSTFTPYGYLDQATYYDGAASSVLNVGGTSSFANAIMDDGTVLGESVTYPNHVTVPRAWVLENGVKTVLAARGDLYAETSASDINASGVVVGNTESANGNYYFHAARWQNNVLQDLGTGGAFYQESSALGISDAGDILVESYRDVYSGDGIGQGFIWSNGSLTKLPTFGGAQSNGSSMNAFGQVVGEAQDASGTNHPFLWSKSGGMLSLDNVLAGTSYYGFAPSAINDQGQILGFASIRVPAGYSVGYAMLLTPQAVPEPATFVALGVGAVGLLRRRRKG